MVVTRVIDGDTIEVQIGGVTYRVRYIGVDTPEQGDWLATEATQLNAQLVAGKTIRLEKDVSNTEPYVNGRLLRYVYVGDLFVNAELVKAGLSRATPYLPDVKHETLFRNMEGEARAAAKGLWANPQIIRILYDGLVPSVESDEYVEISNFSGKPADLTGWVLADKKTASKSFKFPSYVLNAGKTIRVYTNEKHSEWSGFSFGSRGAIWRNSEPEDTAVLKDRRGTVVSRRTYQVVK